MLTISIGTLNNIHQAYSQNLESDFLTLSEKEEFEFFRAPFFIAHTPNESREGEMNLAQTNTPRDPHHTNILTFGAFMSIPAYFSTVIIHEGSHALAGKALGGEIIEFKILPFKKNGALRFGETGIEGEFNKSEKTLLYLAPKITNLVSLSGYTYILEKDQLPENKYAQTALATLVTAQWVDFSKSVFDTHRDSDLSRVYALHDFSKTQEYSFRALQGAVSAIFAYEVGKGIYQIFDCPSQKKESTAHIVCETSPNGLEWGILKEF